MTPRVNPIPDDCPHVTPYLCCKNAGSAIDFYKNAFGAIEVMRMAQPDGVIGHAELKFGDSVIMLADEFPEIDFLSPQTLGGSPVMILLYVENVDAVVEKAVAAGSKLTRPVENQFYGDRSGKLIDPFGHTWMIATRIENISQEEMEKRAAAMSGGQ